MKKQANTEGLALGAGGVAQIGGMQAETLGEELFPAKRMYRQAGAWVMVPD